MKDRFLALAAHIDTRIGPGEVHLTRFYGEDSDFVRLNRARVVQAGNVSQAELAINLVGRRRQASGRITLGGSTAEDVARIDPLIAELRSTLALLPEDPHLLHATERRDSESVLVGHLPGPEMVIESVARHAPHLDLVGLWACGAQFNGFASSTGQRNWHARASYNFDWSVHGAGGQAVKRSLGGACFDPDELDRQIEEARAELVLLEQPPCTLEPGRYRAYLAPAAVAELFELLSWNGFGLRSGRTRRSPLSRMQPDRDAPADRAMSDAITLTERCGDGMAPPFTSTGYARPPVVTLIEAGRWRQHLVPERSAAEYGEAVNASGESPDSLDLAPGGIERDAVLDTIGDGIYVSNLWYCNYSDPNECRITGMTRFASFRVEGGRKAAPLAPMRFDESLYHALGDGLVGLTTERELLIDPGTYGRRSSASMRLPGVVIDGFHLTL